MLERVTTMTVQEQKATSSFFPWLICGLAALFYCYEFFLRISPSVMTHELMQAYNLTAAALGNLSAFYLYAYTPMQLPVGVMMDRYGPRRLLTVATLLCAIGTYLFAMSNLFAYAAIGRFLVGFGSAFAFVGVLKLAVIWLPPERFAMISGLATALGAVGAIIGDNSLAALVQLQGWRSTVYMSATVGIVLAIVIFVVVRDHRQTADEVAIKQSGYRALFISLLELIRQPQIWLNGLVGFLMYLPTSAFADLWGVPYLEHSYHLSRIHASRAISMIYLGWAIGGPLAGLISDRMRRRCMPMVIGSMIAAILIAMVLYMPGIPEVGVYIILFIFGVFSSAQVIVFAIGRELSPAKLSGTAIALTNMIVMMGGVIFQPMIGKLLDKHWSGELVNNVHVYSVNDYRYALMVLPIGLMLAAVITLFIRETHCRLQEI